MTHSVDTDGHGYIHAVQIVCTSKNALSFKTMSCSKELSFQCEAVSNPMEGMKMPIIIKQCILWQCMQEMFRNSTKHLAVGGQANKPSIVYNTPYKQHILRPWFVCFQEILYYHWLVESSTMRR